MNLEYEKNGDYMIPNLKPCQEPEGHLRKYGLKRKYYLLNFRGGTYSALVLKGELKKHLLSVQEQVEQRYNVLVEQMAKCEGVTEELKAQNQMLWIRKMNEICSRADEIVLREIVYLN